MRLGLLIVILSLIHCQRTQDPDSLKVRLRNEPGTFQWVKSSDMDTFRVLSVMLDPLIKLSTDRKFVPAAAKSWKVSRDRKTYTFLIDTTRTWNDGTPVTSHDFVRAAEWILKPENASPALSLYLELLRSGKVRAPDGTTFVIELDRPRPYLLSTLVFFYPLHPKEDCERSRIPQYVNGPYKVAEWKENRWLHLTPYGAERKNRKDIRFYFVNEDSMAVRLFESGQLDIVEYPSWFDMKRFQKKQSSALKVFPTERMIYLVLRPEGLNLKSPQVREGLFRAIDRKKLAAVRDLYWRPANYVVPQSFLPEIAAGQFKFNFVRAKKLLEPLAGKELTLLIAGQEDQRLIAEVLQEQWRQAGVKARVWPLEWKAYLRQKYAPTTQAFLASWSGSHPHAHTFLEIFLQESKPGFKLQEKSFRAWVKGERPEAWAQAARLLTEGEFVVLPLVRESLPLLLQERNQTLEVSPFGKVNYRKLASKNN